MPARILVPALTALALLLAPAAAPAQEPYVFDLPRVTPGVSATVTANGRAIVKFDRRRAKLLAPFRGRTLDVTCTDIPPDDGLIRSFDVSEMGFSVRVPRRGSVLRFGRLGPRMDTCLVSGATRRAALSVFVVLTDAGRVAMKELRAASLVLTVLAVAQAEAEKAGGTAWPAATALIARVPKVGMVAMDGPAADVPVDRVGYWTDGARHAAFATTSRNGRRLFFEIDGDTLHTNMVMGAFSMV